MGEKTLPLDMALELELDLLETAERATSLGCNRGFFKPCQFQSGRENVSSSGVCESGNWNQEFRREGFPMLG
jgi:hypothetical protein